MASNFPSTAMPTSTQRSLQLELKSIMSEPIEGFLIRLPNDNDIFVWEVSIFGPPDTLYAGGYYKAEIRFPSDYPFSPPRVKFLTKMYHPNIFANGDVCISILHPPIHDPFSGELPSERWNPTQNVRTICLSIISMLNEPNTSSPANVDASVAFRRWKEGKSKDYETSIRNQVAQTRIEAEKDGVTVPTTIAEYCITSRGATTSASLSELENFYDEDYCEDYDDDDGGDCDGMDEELVGEDSGNSDS